MCALIRYPRYYRTLSRHSDWGTDVTARPGARRGLRGVGRPVSRTRHAPPAAAAAATPLRRRRHRNLGHGRRRRRRRCGRGCLVQSLV